MQKLKLNDLIGCALLQAGHSTSELRAPQIGDLCAVWDDEYEVILSPKINEDYKREIPVWNLP